MSDSMSVPVFFTTAGLMFGTILIVFAMKYLSAAYQARSKAAIGDAYQDLAQKAEAAQSETAASLSALSGEVALIKASLTGVEKMLREVG